MGSTSRGGKVSLGRRKDALCDIPIVAGVWAGGKAAEADWRLCA
jgi:hypothetical protein